VAVVLGRVVMVDSAALLPLHAVISIAAQKATIELRFARIAASFPAWWLEMRGDPPKDHNADIGLHRDTGRLQVLFAVLHAGADCEVSDVRWR
jgi:hypothetical protein